MNSNLHGTSEQLSIFMGLGSAPSFIFMPLVPMIKKAIGKKNMFYVFLGIAIVAMGEELGAEMAQRSFEHLMQYGEPAVRRAVPLAIGLLDDDVGHQDVPAVPSVFMALAVSTDDEVKLATKREAVGRQPIGPRPTLKGSHAAWPGVDQPEK